MSMPMINVPSHPSTCIRPVGLVLATPSNSSPISDDGLTVVPLKRKHSEDIVKVYPQKKITLQAPLGGEPSDHQVDQVPLKRKCSAEFLELHQLNKVARVAVQGIDMPSPMCPCSNEVSSNDWQNLQGCNPITHLDDPVMQNQKLLQEVAMPLFFQLVHFEPSQAPTSLHIESDMLGALLVWRCTNAFVMPDSIWFSVTGATTDRHLQALSIFFESLQGREPMPSTYFHTLSSCSSLSDIPLLEDVLACAAHFPDLSELCIQIPSGTSRRLLEIPRESISSCPVRVLFLMCLDSARHDIIIDILPIAILRSLVESLPAD
ncbi:hypothetical protein BKA83DRAFT_4128483 [Pisolithus microcarpus]|nr:hypothetical protein BKA83DRAFT_4128483 [Pisolithus microcarpus]